MNSVTTRDLILCLEKSNSGDGIWSQPSSKRLLFTAMERSALKVRVYKEEPTVERSYLVKMSPGCKAGQSGSGL